MSRIVPAAALLLVVAAGCGAAGRPHSSAIRRVPPALAQGWESQAAAIAAAASAGNSCRAQQLAATLRADVGAKQHELPSRLRSPLLTGVNALADRIICTPVQTSSHEPPKPAHKPHHEPPKPKPKPPDHHRKKP